MTTFIRACLILAVASNVQAWSVSFYNTPVRLRRHLKSATTIFRPHQSALFATGIQDNESFDFSSSIGWEVYYRNHQNEPDELEWHSSVPLEVLARYCNSATSFSTSDFISILMVGCGTSQLPGIILHQDETDHINGEPSETRRIEITLLDSSATCIDQLKSRYKAHPLQSSIRYVCGDAVQLSTTLTRASLPCQACFDRMVDKGLLDALMCSEGWNGPVVTLLEEVSRVLSCRGLYILVSYRLPKSTKQFLKQQGERFGLVWEFDCPGSNERVGISVATKTREGNQHMT